MKTALESATALRRIALAIATALAPWSAATAATTPAPKPVIVESAIPARTFAKTVRIDSGNFIIFKLVGPGSGVFGITSITVTNWAESASDVYVYLQPSTNGVTCDASTPQAIFSDPVAILTAPANGTLHVPYPTPLVATAASGSLTCIIVGAIARVRSGTVYIGVNGIVN